MSETIDVTLLGFPDGRHIWIRTDLGPEYQQRCIKAWEETVPAETRSKWMDAGVCAGAVVLRMLEDHYNRIPTTNGFPWPELGTGVSDG